jgi:hypothetical protein
MLFFGTGILVLSIVSMVSSFSHSKRSLCVSHSRIFSEVNQDSTDSSMPPATKGFGAVKKKATVEVEKDEGTLTYEKQSKRGIPEYNIFLRPENGTETEWIPAGSMTIPRDTPPSKAIYDVEKELLSGSFKLYPKLKAFYELRKDSEKASAFEYGYVLKAFPDEEIKLAVREGNENKSNFFMNWVGRLTNPIDNTDLKNKGTVTIKQ